MVKRVAVVGAGIGGLAAIKHCLEEDLDPVCFELRADLGGLWNYSPDPPGGRPNVLKTTLANACKVGFCNVWFTLFEIFVILVLCTCVVLRTNVFSVSDITMETFREMIMKTMMM